MHRFLHCSAATALLTLSAAAQLTLVAPQGLANAEGNSNNIYPWGRTTSTHYLQIFDSTHFTAQNVTGPILITNLRFRADAVATTTTWAGGTWPNVGIFLSTSAVNYSAISTTFAANHGPDVANVRTGPVTVLPGAGNGTGVPGIWHIDIPLTTPFLYDPTSGNDLAMEVQLDGSGWSGTTFRCDAMGAGAMCSRAWELSSATSPVASGTSPDYGLVCEFSYVPPAGYAYSSTYGDGCVERASASFYELFPNGTFDLSNTTLQLVPTGNGYAVLPGAPAWFTPTTTVTLADDQVSGAQPLGFTLSYPGGSTSNVYISSNGFVYGQASAVNGCCAGSPGALLGGGPCWSAVWNDLNPSAGGNVYFDTDPANSAAYVTFVNVPEFGTTNLNTFQFAFFANGTVEIRFQACSVLGHVVLTGWSPGTSNLDPGSIDISATPVIVTQPDSRALRHRPSGRPVLGTTISLDTTNVPANAVIGATVFGLADLVPGIDLTPIGMPGCYQHVAIDASQVWVPNAGTGSTMFALPNVAAFAGVQIKTQGAVLAPGINTTGAATSNGLRLFIDQN